MPEQCPSADTLHWVPTMVGFQSACPVRYPGPRLLHSPISNLVSQICFASTASLFRNPPSSPPITLMPIRDQAIAAVSSIVLQSNILKRLAKFIEHIDQSQFRSCAPYSNPLSRRTNPCSVGEYHTTSHYAWVIRNVAVLARRGLAWQARIIRKLVSIVVFQTFASTSKAIKIAEQAY